MNVYFSTELPESGQFVCVWTHKDNVWCDTYKWIDGAIHQYSEVDDNFIPLRKTGQPWTWTDKCKFITMLK